MNITRETIKDTLRTVMAEETEYQIFFKKALEKAGKSIPSMSDEEKKEFFNKIDAAWNAKGEKNEDLKGNQHKLDVDGDGEIEASDLAALRAGKKKEESIEESAGCGCGCGTCSESINEATDRDFEKVFNLFNKKDYFDSKGQIKTMLGNWQRALDRGDKGAQKYSKEDVIDSVIAQTKARAKYTYDELVKAIKNKDIKSLKSKLRHNQPFSIAIFTQVTGKKLPKSTRDIHSFLDNEFMNESITEGVKLSEELVFEINTFLERPVLSKNEITLEKSEIKDVVTLLVKEGFQKRLSSGVKREFIELLKKNK